MAGPMGGKPRRNRDHGRKFKTKRRTKDIDQVDEDCLEKNAVKLLNQDVDLDKTGSGQFYCLHCARYFIDDQALTSHFKTKGHKRRLKDLELEPYTAAESDRAAGKGNYFEPKKRKMETQPLKPKRQKLDDSLASTT